MILTELQVNQIEKLREKLQLEYGYEIIPVQIEEYSLPVQCYTNVEEKVKRDGGRVHYGWSVHFTKNIIVEAERHAVWENDTEDLICVTQNPKNFDEVLFLSDDAFVNPSEQVDNVRINITDNILVNDWIYLCDMIGFVYSNYTVRANRFAVNMAKPVQEVLDQLEIWKAEVMKLIQLNRRERSICFCNDGQVNNRKFIHCHKKIFSREIDNMIVGIANFKILS